jgi:hypothetical protein
MWQPDQTGRKLLATYLASECGYEAGTEEQAARIVRLGKDLWRIAMVCSGRTGGLCPVAHRIAADGSLTFDKPYYSNLRCSLLSDKVALVMDSLEMQCLWHIGSEVSQLVEIYLDYGDHPWLQHRRQVSEALLKAPLSGCWGDPIFHPAIA